MLIDRRAHTYTLVRDSGGRDPDTWRYQPRHWVIQPNQSEMTPRAAWAARDSGGRDPDTWRYQPRHWVIQPNQSEMTPRAAWAWPRRTGAPDPFSLREERLAGHWAGAAAALPVARANWPRRTGAPDPFSLREERLAGHWAGAAAALPVARVGISRLPAGHRRTAVARVGASPRSHSLRLPNGCSGGWDQQTSCRSSSDGRCTRGSIATFPQLATP